MTLLKPPMGQQLRKSLFTIFLIVSILLIWGGRSTAWAQISLDSDSPLEIRFSQGETIRNQSSLTVGLSDIKSIMGREFTPANNKWQPYGEAQNSEFNYFVSDNSAFVAPGRMLINGSPYQTFFTSSFQNNSGHNIGNMLLAYDFIYNFYGRSDAQDLELKYKVNNGEWKNVQSGVIESSTLRSAEDSWSSISIHLNIDDIFLRKSDTLHLMWVIDEADPVTNEVPIALQRMEIFPEKMEQNSLQRGDLIITEILPRSNVNGADFEYVEVYNPGEKRLSLKGAEFFTSLGSKVIQQDLYVEPYDFIVISNTDISNLENVDNSYFYSGSITDENRGRVGIEYDGSLIASATYEAVEPGVSLELNRVSRAYDGYTSLQDFVPSQLSYFQDLYGSPGTSGQTNPMYKKELVDRGLYLLTFPGNGIQRLNRQSSLEFFNLNGEPVNLDTIEPYLPVLVQKSDNVPQTIFTESLPSTSSKGTPFSQLTPSSNLLSAPVTSGAGTGALQKSAGMSRAAPITLKWNLQRQKFELQAINQVEQDSWSPFVLHESVTTLMNQTDGRITGPTLDRFIEFTLTPESDPEAQSPDRAILGFMDSPAQNNQLRYDLPKLELLPATNGKATGQALLYLTSTLSEETYNSFTHLPFEISQEYEIGLGTKMADNTGSGVVEWELNEELPEEWILILEDTFDGTTVNLREVNQYRFRYSKPASEINENTEQETPRIASVSTQDRPRFIVKVQPYASFAENSEEQETPDTIELRPNYPNPFNPSTNINFYLPEERTVRVGVYNIVGQQVALLLDDTIQQGEHSLMWDASDKPSGIYIVQLETGNRIFTRKITLIK